VRVCLCDTYDSVLIITGLSLSDRFILNSSLISKSANEPGCVSTCVCVVLHLFSYISNN